MCLTTRWPNVCILWKCTFYRNDNCNLSMTCQCWQLKLNPLSTQINFYCLMTNETPALLVQHAPWIRAEVMLLQSLYSSCPPQSPYCYNSRRPPPRYILKSRWPPLTVRRTISWRSHEKIGDCEQSISIEILCQAPWSLQVQSIGLPSSTF